MAHLGEYRGGANWKGTSDLMYEDVEPSYGWIEDTDNHYLLIDLPERFKREEVKLQVDICGNVMVSGERKVREYKFIRFQISSKAPANSKSEDASARLEDGILYVIIPKEVPEIKGGDDDVATTTNTAQEETQQKKTEEKQSSISDGTDQNEGDKEAKNEASEEEEFHDAKMAKKWHRSNLMEAAKETLRNNRSVILTALVAFSLGLLVSHKSQSSKID